MSESPAPYDGGDERPASRTLRILNRFKDEDPEGYEILFGETAGVITTQDYTAAIARWKERAETAERALLKTWRSQVWRRTISSPARIKCRVCERHNATVDGHAPDCLIPPLLERYGEG